MHDISIFLFLNLTFREILRLTHKNRLEERGISQAHISRNGVHKIRRYVQNTRMVFVQLSTTPMIYCRRVPIQIYKATWNSFFLKTAPHKSRTNIPFFAMDTRCYSILHRIISGPHWGRMRTGFVAD